jgi:hypothetical protein
MTTSFAFRDKIPSMIGGRAALLAKSREMLVSTHRITKASDPSRIPVESVRRHVVDTVLAAIVALLREPLKESLRAHFIEVGEEHELFEGAPPIGAESGDWMLGLDNRFYQSLEGEVASLIPAIRLSAIIHEGGSAAAVAEIVDELLATPTADVSRALGACGVTASDIEEMAEEIRQPPVSNVVLTNEGGGYPTYDEDPLKASIVVGEPILIMTATGLANIVRRRLADGEDFFDIHEKLVAIFGGSDDTARAFVGHPTLAESLCEFTKDAQAVGEGNTEAAWQASADEIMRMATAPRNEARAATAEAIAPTQTQVVPEKIPPRRKRGPVAPEVSPATEAGKAALVALCDHGGIPEQALADLIGVSRAQMNNYRYGRTIWAPDDLQVAALANALTRHITALDAARESLMEIVA